MGPFKLMLAPLRRIVRFPLFQLAVTVAVILWLEAAPDASISGQIYSAIDHVVDFTVQRCAALFDIKSFTRSWLTAGFWIAYVYLIGLVILYLLRALVASVAILILTRATTGKLCQRRSRWRLFRPARNRRGP